MLKKVFAVLTMASLVLTLGLTQAANAAKGTPGPPEGGGEDTTPNSLSVPVINVGTTGAPFTCSSTAAVMPTGDTLTFPTDFISPITTPPEGGSLPVAGEYYIQGVNTWQAECGNAADNTLTVNADWGDNLGGDAKTSVGSPVRVEVGLMVTNTEYQSMMGFDVVKLTEELDRYATYGTMGLLEDLDEVRAYDDGARLRIYFGDTLLSDDVFSAELNSTGRIVYGYNWTPAGVGQYTLEFYAPSVQILNADDPAEGHTYSIDVTIDDAAGGGGGGGNGGGGGGGRPDNPGGGGGPRGPR
jgi:hypothetical protein